MSGIYAAQDSSRNRVPPTSPAADHEIARDVDPTVTDQLGFRPPVVLIESARFEVNGG
jgi:hypothetical protein